MLAKLQLSFANFFFAKPELRKTRVRLRAPRISVTKSEPELLKIWDKLKQEYFPTHQELNKYQIAWSTRAQKRTLASCNIQYKRVVVARELNYPNYQQWLEPLIYHEMCHAVIGFNVKKNRKGRAWHGAEFKNLERQHPQMAEFDLWAKSGGWLTAVRSDRGRRVAARRFKIKLSTN